MRKENGNMQFFQFPVSLLGRDGWLTSGILLLSRTWEKRLLVNWQLSILWGS